MSLPQPQPRFMQRKPNPACGLCRGQGKSYSQGPGGMLGPCACLGWKGDYTPAEWVAEGEFEVGLLKIQLDAAEARLVGYRENLAKACPACGGSKRITVGAKTYPCPREGCGEPPCATCAGAGTITVAGMEYPCPEKCGAGKVGVP